jgi:hypothetical protein
MRQAADRSRYAAGPGHSTRAGSAVTYGLGRGAAASDHDTDQGDLCAATGMTRSWHARICR